MRTTFTGPENCRPLTVASWPSLTKWNSSTLAPIEACQGNPFRAETTISFAAGVSRETTPVASSLPPSIRIWSVWPTPLAMSWPKRMGRLCVGIDRPARSTTTGNRQPAIFIVPPVYATIENRGNRGLPPAAT